MKKVIRSRDVVFHESEIFEYIVKPICLLFLSSSTHEIVIDPVPAQATYNNEVHEEIP